MTNIVMIARDRKDLTCQALETLRRNTAGKSYTLTIVDDGSDPALGEWPWMILRIEGPPSGRVGFVRNLGTYFSEHHFGRGDYLYFSDNDVAFFPGWLDRMVQIMKGCPQVKILGGQRHPYHRPNSIIPHAVETRYVNDPGVEICDAVAGYSMLMSWETWDKYGPFDDHAAGVGQSEDFALCQKVKTDGYEVGYIYPPVLAHCGITNTFGQPATGAESFERFPGLLYE